MNPEPRHPWEITVGNDGLARLGAAVLLIVCGRLLVREIDHFIWGSFAGPVLLHRGFWTHKVFEAIAAIYCLLFAFRFAKNSVRIACALRGINFAGSFLLSSLQISFGMRHIATLSGSVVREIALVLFCVAIAQWLNSVIHRGPLQEAQGDRR